MHEAEGNHAAIAAVPAGKRVRCPYCTEGEEFKLMSSYKDAEDNWYICGTCGHLVASSNPAFRCPCSKCTELASVKQRKRM